MKNIFSKFFLFMGMILSVGAVSMAQNHNTGIVKGVVRDAETNKPIPFVNVFVKGTTAGMATNVDGYFIIKGLPTGNYTLIARCVGYSEKTKSIHVVAGKSKYVNFELKNESIDLDGVVISANRQVTMRRLAPSLVTILTNKVFAMTHSENLSQGLRFQPGIRVEDNCQNCGFNQVRINGLDGAYSQILIDSRPIFSALAGVYGLEQIPASMIQRVEVMRGGGSALYGSNAIGGVINIITKEPERNTASITSTATALGTDNNKFTDVQMTTSYNGSLVSDDRKAAVMFFGQHSMRPPHDFNGDGFSEIPTLRQRSLGFRAYYKTSLYSKITAEFRSMQEYRRGGNRFDAPPFEAEIAEYLQHFVNGANLSYHLGSPSQKYDLNVYGSFQTVTRRSFYGGGDWAENLIKIFIEHPDSESDEYKGALASLTSYGVSKGLDANGGATFIYKFSDWADLTSGLDYTYSSIKDQSGYRPSPINQTVNTYSNFEQLQLKWDKFTFLLGGRLDYIHLDQGGFVPNPKPILEFSPRINLRYNPTKDLALRISYSKGFRAPQFYNEDMHVELAGGEPKVRVLSNNLKPERSHSISTSADWYTSFGNFQLNLMAEGFYTIIENKFTDTEPGDSINGKKRVLVINANDKNGYTLVAGVNFEGKLAYKKLLNLQAGITLQTSKYGSPQEVITYTPYQSKDTVTISNIHILHTPNIYGYFTAEVRPTHAFSIALSGTYSGAMYVEHDAYQGFGDLNVPKANIHGNHFSYVKDGEQYQGVINPEVIKSKPFWDIDLKLGYEFHLSPTLGLTLSAGIQNLFNSYQSDWDLGPGRASAFIYGPMLPRRAFLSATFNIE